MTTFGVFPLERGGGGKEPRICGVVCRTWSVFLHPGGERILFRFGPDFVAFTRGRALSRFLRVLLYFMRSVA